MRDSGLKTSDQTGRRATLNERRARGWTPAAAVAALVMSMAVSIVAPPTASAERPPELPDWSVQIPYSIKTVSYSHANIFGDLNCITAWFAVFDGDTYGASTIPGTPNPTEDVSYVYVQGVSGLPPVLEDRFVLGTASHTWSRGGFASDFPDAPATTIVTEGSTYSLLIGQHAEYRQDPREDNFCTTGDLGGDNLERIEATVLWTIDPVDPPEAVPPVVNSIGDTAALDPATLGCDTGGTIGSEPECTLRAAIETANATPDGSITFDIDGEDVPVIAPESILPDVAQSTSIDGTTQSAGSVKLVSGNGLKIGLRLTSGTSVVTGMEIEGFETAIDVTGGSGHELTGNRIGIAGPEVLGAMSVADTSGVTIADNVMRCASCVVLGNSPGAVVENNGISVDDDGSLLDVSSIGVAVFDGDATVRSNVIRTSTIGVLVAGPGAAGSVVEANRVGVGRDGLGFEAEGEAIRIDGAPGVTVAENVVATDGPGNIMVSGSAQVLVVPGEEEGTFGLRIFGPEDNFGGTVTGGGTVVENNTIGLLADGVTPSSKANQGGVTVWAGASDVRVESNTIGAVLNGVYAVGGSGLTVTGNQLGVGARTDPGFGAKTTHGVVLEGTRGSTVGTIAAGNRIVAALTGVALEESANPKISGNTIDSSVGVDLRGEVEAAKLTDNLIRGNGGSDIGLRIGSNSESTVITGNTVVGHDYGIRNSGIETTIVDNHIGVERDNTVNGNTVGIRTTRSVTVQRNVVAGSGSVGVVVESGVASLSANEIRLTTGAPIDTKSGPRTPDLAAALDVSRGSGDRTMLIVAGLPESGTGTVEVFANGSCSDPEAEHVLNVRAEKEAGRNYVIIPLVGFGGRDNFTTTFTNDTAGTSAVSNCQARGVYPDTDGDGSPDPLEDLVGTANDATSALVVTDQGDILGLQTDGGSLSGVGIVEDPAPGGHPGGFTMPHGVIDFNVTGLEEGAAVTVRIARVDGETPIGGDAYWKYGPNPGSAGSSWFRFDLDDDSGTGATSVVASNADGDFVPAWELRLVDGGRGDNDGLANGTISDPGGPGIEADTSGSTTTTQPATGAGTTVITVPPTLPATGTGTRVSMAFAMLCLALGLGVVSLSRRRGPGHTNHR